MKKILMIVGSLREQSFNRQLAEKAAEMMAGRAEVTYLNYADVPFMNQDMEFPVPEPVARVRSEVMAADGIWIFTPEYNSSYPGVLKNLLDWLSRPLEAGNFQKGTAVSGKKVTISGAGGKAATLGAREKLLELLQFIRMSPMETTGTGVAAGKAFMTNVLELSEETVQTLQHQVEEFLKYIEA